MLEAEVRLQHRCPPTHERNVVVAREGQVRERMTNAKSEEEKRKQKRDSNQRTG